MIDYWVVVAMSLSARPMLWDRSFAHHSKFCIRSEEWRLIGRKCNCACVLWLVLILKSEVKQWTSEHKNEFSYMLSMWTNINNRLMRAQNIFFVLSCAWNDIRWRLGMQNFASERHTRRNTITLYPFFGLHMWNCEILCCACIFPSQNC